VSEFMHSLQHSGKSLMQDPSVKACSRAGINLLSKEKVKLELMQDSLKYTISELSESKSRMEFASAALLGLRIVKANCDAFIKLSNSAAQILLPKVVAKQAAAVTKGYENTKNYVGVRMAAEEGKLDVRSANGMIKSATEKVPGAKYIGTNVDIFHSAMTQDYKTLKRDLFNFVYEVHKDGSKMLVTHGRRAGQLSKQTARNLGNTFKAIDATKSMVFAAVDYSNALDSAFNEKISDDDFARELGSQIQTAKGKLLRIEREIQVITKALQECGRAPDFVELYGLT